MGQLQKQYLPEEQAGRKGKVQLKAPVSLQCQGQMKHSYFLFKGAGLPMINVMWLILVSTASCRFLHSTIA